MKIGLTLPHLGSIARRENIIRLAVDAEAEGFDSLWVAERLLWPLNPQTPYQPTSDGSLPTFIKMCSILWRRSPLWLQIQRKLPLERL